jgi:hypothetical protein
MPQLGDKCHGYDIDKKNRDIYIWEECPNCHQQRWVAKHRSKKRNHLGVCFRCRCLRYGKDNPKWRGGYSIDANGYPRIVLSPGDFFLPMADKYRSVLEHRLVMAKSLGRNLQSWEIVHHKNHIRDDNRIENLQLVGLDKHTQITRMEQRIKKLEVIIEQLKAENKQLKSSLTPTV